MVEAKEIIERLDAKKILETVNNEGATIVAVRHCCDDEDYAVGDWCRDSYDWNIELDQSSYYDDEPNELPGTCGIGIWHFTDLDSDEVDEAKELLSRAIEKASCYLGRLAIIVGYKGYEYGQDEDEVIIRDAQVIALL
jgi:hypothetical protein|nr:MAG TPA: hypothetical protein [Caudoviricetes sp.]